MRPWRGRDQVTLNNVGLDLCRPITPAKVRRSGQRGSRVRKLTPASASVLAGVCSTEDLKRAFHPAAVRQE